MITIKPEKGIPIPQDGRYGIGNAAKYPWADMDVGDSVQTDCTTLSGARSSAYKAGASHKPKKFKAGLHDGKLRIWRVK